MIDNSFNRYSMISDILIYLQENFTQNLVAKEVARKFGLCPYKFSRLFNQETGTKFDLYIQNLRLSLAQKLINEGAQLKEACYSAGFQSESQFQRVFKQRLGVTPKEYRNGKILSKEEVQKDIDWLMREYVMGLNNGWVGWEVSFKTWLEINNHYSMISHNKFKKLS